MLDLVGLHGKNKYNCFVLPAYVSCIYLPRRFGEARFREAMAFDPSPVRIGAIIITNDEDPCRLTDREL